MSRKGREIKNNKRRVEKKNLNNMKNMKTREKAICLNIKRRIYQRNNFEWNSCQYCSADLEHSSE